MYIYLQISGVSDPNAPFVYPAGVNVDNTGIVHVADYRGQQIFQVTGYVLPSSCTLVLVLGRLSSILKWFIDVYYNDCLQGSYSQYSSKQNCTQCPIGTFCMSGATRPALCPPGYFCLPASIFPFPCPAGYSCNSTVMPVPCSFGYYSNSAATSCLLCSPGTYPVASAAPACLACPNGTYCLGGNCAFSLIRFCLLLL
jgi:hypothetical protein